MQGGSIIRSHQSLDGLRGYGPLLCLLQAIALVGGVTPFGGRNGILIYRSTPGGKSLIEVSYRDIVSGKRPDDNVLLEAGDTVVVR